MTARPPDQSESSIVARLARAHLERLRATTALLMWALFLPTFLANVLGFVMGFFGMQFFRFVSLGIGTAGTALCLIAVYHFVLAAAEVPITRRLGRVLLVLAGAYALVFTLSRTGSMMDYSFGHWQLVGDLEEFLERYPLFFYAEELIELSAVLIGVLLFRQLSRCFSADRLGREFAVFSVAMLLYNLASLFLFSQLLTYLTGSPFQNYFAGTDLLGQVVLGLWGLLLLHRFRKMLQFVLENRCANCSYSLHGLPEPRCPECGRPAAIAVRPGWGGRV